MHNGSQRATDSHEAGCGDVRVRDGVLARNDRAHLLHDSSCANSPTGIRQGPKCIASDQTDDHRPPHREASLDRPRSRNAARELSWACLFCHKPKSFKRECFTGYAWLECAVRIPVTFLFLRAFGHRFSVYRAGTGQMWRALQTPTYRGATMFWNLVGCRRVGAAEGHQNDVFHVRPSSHLERRSYRERRCARPLCFVRLFQAACHARAG